MTVPSTAEFRSQLVAWLDENELTPPPGDHSLDAHQAQHCPRAERTVRRGLDALRLAGIGGRAWRARDTARRRRRGDRRPRAGPSRAVLDARSAGPDDDRLRAPRTRRGDGAEAAVRPRRAWCQGLFRAGFRQRPGVAVDPRRAARRRLGGQRPEGVDQFRAVRDAVRPAHPHRGTGNPEPRSHHRIFRRPRHTGNHCAPAAHDARRGRVLRGVLRRRGGAGRPHARRARRRLAAGDGSAALRTLDLLLAAHRLPVLAVRRADR